MELMQIDWELSSVVQITRSDDAYLSSQGIIIDDPDFM